MPTCQMNQSPGGSPGARQEVLPGRTISEERGIEFGLPHPLEELRREAEELADSWSDGALEDS
jgi:hypothetical protein